MPELPEVETVRLGLMPVLEGRRLVRVTLRRADLRRPFPKGFARALEGRRIERLGRRGKYLLAHLDDGLVLIVHLGMSGRIKVFDGPPPTPGPHDHVAFATDGGATLYYCDPRRFGLMTLARAEDFAAHPLFRNMGPDPLENGFNAPVLAARLAGRRGPIKTALMDQGVVAGLGNIYASEILFRAGLSPRRRADTVKGLRAERLVAAIGSVLREAIAAGGSTLRDHRAPDGELGYFQHHFAVYGRVGEPCPGCDCEVRRTGGIAQMTQSGRSTFYCARRQR